MRQKKGYVLNKKNGEIYEHDYRRTNMLWNSF